MSPPGCRGTMSQIAGGKLEKQAMQHAAVGEGKNHSFEIGFCLIFFRAVSFQHAELCSFSIHCCCHMFMKLSLTLRGSFMLVMLIPVLCFHVAKQGRHRGHPVLVSLAKGGAGLTVLMSFAGQMLTLFCFRLLTLRIT